MYLRYTKDIITHLETYKSMQLSKPQPNLNTTVGFDNKMTLQTPPQRVSNSLFSEGGELGSGRGRNATRNITTIGLCI